MKRSGLLAQVFGSRVGIQMANLVKSGAMAMDDLAESATGIISQETIDNAEAFNDTMNRLKRQVLAPLQSAFVNTAKAILNFAETMGLIKPDLFTKSLGELNEMLSEQQRIIDKNNAALDRFDSKNRKLVQYRKPLDRAEEQKKLIEETIIKRKKQIEIEKQLQLTQEDGVVTQDNFNNTIKDSIVITKDFADTIDGQLTTAFTNFFDATNKQFLDFKDLATSVVRAVINELIQVFIVQKAVGMVKGSINAFRDSIYQPIDSAVEGIGDFDGGGFTGKGIRAGGMDGKGGFMAMLHPNETVIDHTKGQAMQSAPTVNFNISTVDAAGFDQLLASRKGLITSIINNAMNNQGKMGVV